MKRTTTTLLLMLAFAALFGLQAYNQIQNQAVLNDVQVQRREGAIAGVRTVLIMCRDYRGIELQRVKENHKPSKINESLKLLHLAKTPALMAAIDRAYRRDLERYSLAGCEKLPSVRRGRAEYGSAILPTDTR